MKRRSNGRVGAAVAVAVAVLSITAVAAPPGESPNLGTERIQQSVIENGELSIKDLRTAGLIVFSTPFNELDGYGDGPLDITDTVTPGGRPTLQGNGTFLRVNGLDAQTCLECHSIVSAATIPAQLGIGGVGGSNSNAIAATTAIDPADLDDLDSVAGFNGRFINPPFVFGAGAVELLGLEMTADLQKLAAIALSQPGVEVELVTKGVSFGSIVAGVSGELDLSNVSGVANDLVVRPFGRKGEFATTRDFDVGAMQFHFGMQPVEVVGPDFDADGDGVVNEILIGELSALHVFVATMDRPFAEPLSSAAARGAQTFQDAGCAVCHIPSLETLDVELPLRYPAVPTDHEANVYYRVDLTQAPSSFEPGGTGGIVVPLFADLKRHDMGPGLAENLSFADDRTNREFTTARLWGVADTAPYLHDGRATTLTDAILLHGGEAQTARDVFDALPDASREDVLAYLRSLRTPVNPAADLLSPVPRMSR
jgi:hypothetical protein